MVTRQVTDPHSLQLIPLSTSQRLSPLCRISMCSGFMCTDLIVFCFTLHLQQTNNKCSARLCCRCTKSLSASQVSYLARVPDDPVSHSHGAPNTLLPDSHTQTHRACMATCTHTHMHWVTYSTQTRACSARSDAYTDGETTQSINNINNTRLFQEQRKDRTQRADVAGMAPDIPQFPVCVLCLTHMHIYLSYMESEEHPAGRVYTGSAAQGRQNCCNPSD